MQVKLPDGSSKVPPLRDGSAGSRTTKENVASHDISGVNAGGPGSMMDLLENTLWNRCAWQHWDWGLIRH